LLNAKDCSKCNVFEENPEEFATEICSKCNNFEISPYLNFLLYKINLKQAGCPLRRDELRDEEWLDLQHVESIITQHLTEKHKHKAKMMGKTHGKN